MEQFFAHRAVLVLGFWRDLCTDFTMVEVIYILTISV